MYVYPRWTSLFSAFIALGFLKYLCLVFAMSLYLVLSDLSTSLFLPDLPFCLPTYVGNLLIRSSSS